MKFETIKHNSFNFIVIAFCLIFCGNCSWNKYNGIYVGELKLNTGSSAYGGSREIQFDDEKNLTVLVKQDGKEVFVAVNGSRLLGNCSLRAKIGKNGEAYIDDPQSCSATGNLEGSLNVGNDELVIGLREYSQYSSRHYVFRGFLKK